MYKGDYFLPFGQIPAKATKIFFRGFDKCHKKSGQILSAATDTRVERAAEKGEDQRN